MHVFYERVLSQATFHQDERRDELITLTVGTIPRIQSIISTAYPISR